MTTEGAGIRVLRCRSGAVEWAVGEEMLREIAPAAPAARVPGAHKAVLGVVNVRGGLLAAVDTRLLLGDDTPGEPGGTLVVVALGGRRVALSVDEVDDLHLVPIESLEPAELPAGLPEGSVIALVRETVPFLLLDLEALVAPLFGVTAGKS